MSTNSNSSLDKKEYITVGDYVKVLENTDKNFGHNINETCVVIEVFKSDHEEVKVYMLQSTKTGEVYFETKIEKTTEE